MRGKRVAALGIAAVMLLTGCGGTETGGDAQSQEPTLSSEQESTQNTEQEEQESTQNTEETAESEEEETKVEHSGDKQVVVYFANWNLGRKPGAEGGEVASIPWDSVTYVNHAFWAVEPADGSTETSIERRNEEKEARTQFRVVSTDPAKDYEDAEPSEVNPEIARNHFAEYEYYAKQYPDVNIMISIGGWSRCGYFSEMAYTEEGRKSFVDSCMELLKQYDWIGGIDIDWEYPGGSNDGERKSEGVGDQGCPIFGSPAEDRTNFAALLADLRAALDENFGVGVKKLTACSSASTGWTLPNQDWVAAEPYLDLINIMSYDLAGLWDGVAGNAGSVTGAKSAAVYFKMKGIDMSKLCIGSPMYATAFLLKEKPGKGNLVGKAIENYKPTTDEITEEMLKKFEQEAVPYGEGVGWHIGYDKNNGGAYLFNDDENSEYFKWFLSYENHDSLQGKLDYINNNNLAGIIVWESSQDTIDHEYIRQMADNLMR